MRVLIGCEESQEVCKAFRAKGHEAYSCDILPCSGGHPEWHLKKNVIEELYLPDKWDLIIAHPPCTRLANSGVTWLVKRNLWNDLFYAINFFNCFKSAKCNKIAIENPIPHKYARDGFDEITTYGCASNGIGNYTQLIQPYQFGHPERKATCLWLKGLPKLKPTSDLKKEMEAKPKNEAQRIHWMTPGPERSKLRSKTYPGIAKAMAEQWG